MNPYAKTSNRTGLGFKTASKIRREYRDASRNLAKARDILMGLYSQGKDITKAKEVAEKAELVFWSMDHEARRYKFFYQS
jgi:hypothetical protein